MLGDSFILDPIDTLYLASILGNQPRSIDRFIDYFGGGGPMSSTPNPGPRRGCLAGNEFREARR